MQQLLSWKIMELILYLNFVIKWNERLVWSLQKYLLLFNLSKHKITSLSIHILMYRYNPLNHLVTYTPSDYCWPKALWIKPPRIYFLEASCKLHDTWYEEGGNETRRLVCDLFFYTHMINDINKYCIKYKLFYASWATLYFILVRLFWWTCFNYK